jgi:seryl-tRNA synthetase
MLDIKFVRENRELVEKELNKKAFKSFNLDELFKVDDERRKLILEVDELRQRRNEAAQKRDIEAGKALKVDLEKREAAQNAVEQQFRKEMLKLPNLALENVPEGDESNKKILRTVGEPKEFDFTVKNHLQIGQDRGIIDMERAAKVSGSRFAYLKGDGVLLELALIDLAMKKLVKEGFIPVVPPALIKQEMTEGLGYWQGCGNDNYYLVRNADLEGGEEGLGLYLIGTGEHALVPMHAGEILNEGDLPKKYAAFSPSFRTEAGSYGKDTQGILRVHQFDKVEMVELVRPEDAEKERVKLLEIAESLMKALKLPYQVVQLPSGDLAFPSAETVDIETWIPSQGKYRETHSISTTTDFQARRLNIKYREGTEAKLVHILNGTAFAIGRTIIAIVENYQRKDGSVEVPEVLREYLGKDTL